MNEINMEVFITIFFKLFNIQLTIFPINRELLFQVVNLRLQLCHLLLVILCEATFLSLLLLFFLFALLLLRFAHFLLYFGCFLVIRNEVLHFHIRNMPGHFQF